MNENDYAEFDKPIFTAGSNPTVYDMYYVNTAIGLSIGTGDRFTVVGEDDTQWLAIGIQSLEPHKIMGLKDGSETIIRQFEHTEVATVFPKPRGTR